MVLHCAAALQCGQPLAWQRRGGAGRVCTASLGPSQEPGQPSPALAMWLRPVNYASAAEESPPLLLPWEPLPPARNSPGAAYAFSFFAVAPRRMCCSFLNLIALQISCVCDVSDTHAKYVPSSTRDPFLYGNVSHALSFHSFSREEEGGGISKTSRPALQRLQGSSTFFLSL